MPRMLYVGEETTGLLAKRLAAQSGYDTTVLGTLQEARESIESANPPFDIYFIDLYMTTELRSCAGNPQELAHRVSAAILEPAKRRGTDIGTRVFFVDATPCPEHHAAARLLLPSSRYSLLRLDTLFTGVNLEAGPEQRIVSGGDLRPILEHFRSATSAA